MKVSCPACDSKYTIADEKVAGRKVKVRCKSCGGQILINGTIPPPPPDAAEATNAPGAPTGTSDDEETRIFSGAEHGGVEASDKAPEVASSPAASAPAADDGIVWSVNVSENDERSLKTHEVVQGYLSGEFAGEVYVWRDGMGDWSAIPDVPELAKAIDAAQKSGSKPGAAAKLATKQKTLPSAAKGAKTGETPSQPETAPRKAAARAAGAKRPQSAHDLFAAANSAGSETDIPVSDEEEHKPTGARNENSVLFSLDALKAGITASPTPQKGSPGRKAPEAPRKKLEDLLGDTAAPIATGPAASPLLLAANQQLLTAPAPPPPKPKPEPVVVPEGSAATAAALAEAQRKYEAAKKRGILIGVIAAIVGVGAVAGIAIAMTKSKPEPAPVPSTPAPMAAPVAEAPHAAPKPAEPAAPAPEPTASASSATASSGAAAGPKAGAVAAVGPKATPGATPPKTEPKKETKKEEPQVPVSSGAATFNKDAAAQALAVAASQTSICKKPDGPTGQGKVQVTFAPSGRATTANIVAGPFGGTAVGGCVSGIFKRARVPAFAGDPVTVSKSFSITP